MTNVQELAPRPDADTMREALYALFRHSMQGMVELGWTNQAGELNQAKQFDVGDLDDLVAFAVRLNEKLNQNVYISAGLRRTDIERDHRAADKDVTAIAAVKVDCDANGCMETALAKCEAAGLRPSLAHFSGKHPYLRGALWWVLDEPEPDLDRVHKIEAALSYWLDTDRKVVNASRVMRLPGSVAWPIKANRIKEMTGALTEAATRPAPYTIDELESSLRRAGKDPATAGNHVGGEVINLNEASQTLEIETLIERAREPMEWHAAALKATAHLLGRKTPPDVIIDVLAPRLTLTGYSEAQTRRELSVMIKGALEKGWGPAPADSTPSLSPAVADGRDPFPLLALSQMGQQAPPEWRIDGIIPKRGLGVLYGPSGTYKSFIALDMGLTIAHGLAWRGKPTEPAGVAYIAGEGTYGMPNRIVAWCTHRGTHGSDAPFWLAPVAANFLDIPTVKLIAERLQPLGVKMIVVDTLARSFGAGNENDAVDMNRFVAACDYLKNMCEAFVLAIHHTGVSNQDRARGSSVLKAAADVEISIAKGIDDASAVLSVTKMKDAKDGARVSVRMVEVEGVYPATGEVVTTLVPVIDEAPPVKPATRIGRNERIVLALLGQASPLRFGQIKTQTGIESGTLGRTLKSLLDKNLLAKDAEAYVLTAGASEEE